MGHFRSSLRALLPQAGHIPLQPWSPNAKSNQAVEKFPRSLLKIHILGSTLEILFPALVPWHLIFYIICQVIPMPGSTQDTAVPPEPGMVARSTEGLEETHARLARRGPDPRPLPGVRMASRAGGILVGP